MYGEDFISRVVEEFKIQADEYKKKAEKLVDEDIPLCWQDEEKFDEGTVKSKLSNAFYDLSYALTVLSERLLPVREWRYSDRPALLKEAHKELKVAFQVMKETQEELENL
jgi:hypothetical protein